MTEWQEIARLMDVGQRSDPPDEPQDEVCLDLDALAEQMKRPENSRAFARLLIRIARERLTAQPAPVPARKP